MINYNKILEAVNRGIKFALNDLEDDEKMSSISKQKHGYIEDINWVYEVVNLKYNKIKNNLELLSNNDLKTIVCWYKKVNLKYQAKDEDELHQIISHIVYKIDPCADLNWLDVSNITNMHALFQRTPFNGDISEWDVSKVEDMSYMFDNCIQFTGEHTNLSTWDVSSVKNMRAMFNTCSFNGIHNDLANWDVSEVESMGNMFAYSVFDKDISNWDVSHVKYMDEMFMYSIFNQPIGNWDVSSVHDSSHMFFKASKFNQDLTKWNAKNLPNNTFEFSKISLINLPKGKAWILK